MLFYFIESHIVLCVSACENLLIKFMISHNDGRVRLELLFLSGSQYVCNSKARKTITLKHDVIYE